MPQALFRGLLLFLGIVVPAWHAHGGADFLVVERVDRLVVYNKYQQEVSPQDRRALVPFVPMKVVKENDLLSDGFTPCTQVEIGGSAFFLLKDDNARLVHSGDLGYEQVFRKTSALGDTVQLLRSLPFSPVNSSRQQPLRPGAKVVRIFDHRGGAYCQTLGDSPVYGWVDFGGKREGRDWKVFTSSSPVQAVIPDKVLQNIRSRVNEVNEVFTKLFDRFNAQTHQHRQPPQWNLQVSPDSIVCVLEGAGDPDDFQQSTLYLAKDIENFTLGADLSVTHSSGRIEVATKGDHESQAR